MKKTDKKLNSEVLGSEILISDISVLIEKAREHVAREYNVSHLVLNWMIGKRIEAEVLKHKRGEYGEQIIIEISKMIISEVFKIIFMTKICQMPE